MIARIRGRRTFEALRAHGLRIRRGPLSMTFLDDRPSAPCRVGFAVPKRTGGAVVRNRIRRQLRAIMVELDRDRPELVPSGDLLIGAGPGAVERPFDDLRADVIGLLEDLRLRRGAIS